MSLQSIGGSDQEMPQSQTTDQPIAQSVRDTEQAQFKYSNQSHLSH